MKRIATILLLGLLLFNWIGYRLFTAYVGNKFNRQLQAQIDNNKYDETQLVSIKVPISHLAYYHTSMVFESVDGQVEAGGIVYKYVKRRMYNDTLEMLCIPNRAAMQLNTAKNEFFKLVSDLPTNNSTKKPGSHNNFAKIFSTDNYTHNDCFVFNGLCIAISEHSAEYSENLVSSYSLTDEQPPDLPDLSVCSI